MQLFSWLRKRMTNGPQTRRAPARKPTPRFRPQLEVLESRDVPSTLTVTSAADSGAGSLRAEITAAKANDTIVFAPSLNGQTITLTSGELLISKNLTIQGPGANQLAISGGNTSRVFEVNATQPVVLSGLAISGRGEQYGGAIYNHTALTINDCIISRSEATYGGGIENLGTLAINGSTVAGNTAVSGGGIFNHGTLALTDSTLAYNTASANGAGVYNSVGKLTASGCSLFHNFAYYEGGGIYNSTSSTATLTNSTLSNNSAFGSGSFTNQRAGGGGLYADVRSTATLTNCTLSLDSAKNGVGGGIEVNSGGIVNLINTLVAGNTDAGLTGADIYGVVTTADHNLIGDGTGSSGLVNGSGGNLVGGKGNPILNADLGPLQDNGGPTETMALLADSPAIGQADNSKAPATDQRGVTRMDQSGETTDIGAFEL